MNGQALLSPGNNTTLLPVETTRSPAATLPVPPSPQRYTPLPPATGQAPQGQTMGVTVIPGGGATGAMTGIGRGSISTVRTPNSVVPQMYSPNNAHLPLVMEARVFNEDLQKPSVGTDEYDLAQIVQRLVMWRSWSDARGALMKLLTDRPRKPLIEARAHFYLGQCSYFMGLYREAMAEFVAVQSYFPDETAVWVQATLAKIK